MWTTSTHVLQPDVGRQHLSLLVLKHTHTSSTARSSRLQTRSARVQSPQHVDAVVPPSPYSGPTTQPQPAIDCMTLVFVARLYSPNRHLVPWGQRCGGGGCVQQRGACLCVSHRDRFELCIRQSASVLTAASALEPNYLSYF